MDRARDPAQGLRGVPPHRVVDHGPGLSPDEAMDVLAHHSKQWGCPPITLPTQWYTFELVQARVVEHRQLEGGATAERSLRRQPSCSIGVRRCFEDRPAGAASHRRQDVCALHACQRDHPRRGDCARNTEACRKAASLRGGLEGLEAFGQELPIGQFGPGSWELAETFAVHLLDRVLQRRPVEGLQHRLTHAHEVVR